MYVYDHMIHICMYMIIFGGIVAGVLSHPFDVVRTPYHVSM